MARNSFRLFDNAELNGREGITTKTGLRGMFEGRAYPSLDKVFLFMVAFIDGRTKYEKTAMTLHTDYSEIRANVTGDMLQRTSGEDDPGILESSAKTFGSTSVKTFDEGCSSGL